VLEKIVAAKDTLYKENSASALAELQTKYEVEKKEALIANQRLALVKDRYLQYGSIVVALLGAVIAWLVIRNMRRTAAQEAARAVSTAEETERRRIAADLHDNLGAQLSFIRRNVNFMLDKPGGFGVEDERKYLEYVNETAKAAMIDLRETIWVLNRHEVEVQEFVDKLKSYLRQQLQGQEVVRWNFSEHIRATWRLPSGEVMHLFRITQELISNVLKHSDADMIQIRFEAFEMGAYRLKVEDNGRGFDVRSKQEGHYGMENIHQRAREIGAVLVVESRLSAGTRVVLEKSNENNSFVLLHADSTSVNIAD
jgi:signal transduction histidine kinase